MNIGRYRGGSIQAGCKRLAPLRSHIGRLRDRLEEEGFRMILSVAWRGSAGGAVGEQEDGGLRVGRRWGRDVCGGLGASGKGPLPDGRGSAGRTRLAVEPPCGMIDVAGDGPFRPGAWGSPVPQALGLGGRTSPSGSKAGRVAGQRIGLWHVAGHRIVHVGRVTNPAWSK